MSTTRIWRDGNVIHVAVILANPEKAEAAFQIIRDSVAEEGAERIRISFENITIVEQSS